MRVAVRITLTESEKSVLKKNVASRAVSVRLCERSQIILLAAEGLENKDIAQQLNIHPNKIGRWRNRFVEGGIESLSKEKPRGGNHGGQSTLKQARLRKKIIERLPVRNRPMQHTGLREHLQKS
jgi:transposase